MLALHDQGDIMSGERYIPPGDIMSGERYISPWDFMSRELCILPSKWTLLLCHTTRGTVCQGKKHTTKQTLLLYQGKYAYTTEETLCQGKRHTTGGHHTKGKLQSNINQFAMRIAGRPIISDMSGCIPALGVTKILPSPLWSDESPCLTLFPTYLLVQFLS